MRRWIRERVSLVWLGVGIAAGVLAFAVLLPAAISALQPHPAATYASRELSHDELMEFLRDNGVMAPETTTSSARIIEGPDASMLVISDPDFLQDCLMRVQDQGLDYLGCARTGWPLVLTVPVRSFTVEADVVKEVEDADVKGLMLIYHEGDLTVWPTGPAPASQ